MAANVLFLYIFPHSISFLPAPHHYLHVNLPLPLMSPLLHMSVVNSHFCWCSGCCNDLLRIGSIFFLFIHFNGNCVLIWKYLKGAEGSSEEKSRFPNYREHAANRSARSHGNGWRIRGSLHGDPEHNEGLLHFATGPLEMLRWHPDWV